MDEFSTYYSKVAAICSKAEKCTFDIKRKLEAWGISNELSEKIIAKLVDEKFIDDARYAEFFVKDKFRFNKWGRVKISYMLRQNNISPEIISGALRIINEDDYEDVLVRLLQEKAKKVSAKNQYDKKAKLLRFAQSHGFESNLILSLLYKLDEK